MKIIALTLGAFLLASTAAVAGPCLGGHDSAEVPPPTVGT
jgi:hypothetical protein